MSQATVISLKPKKHLSTQASKALYSLSHIFDGNELCISDKLKVFDSLVLPILFC